MYTLNPVFNLFPGTGKPVMNMDVWPVFDPRRADPVRTGQAHRRRGPVRSSKATGGMIADTGGVA